MEWDKNPISPVPARVPSSLRAVQSVGEKDSEDEEGSQAAQKQMKGREERELPLCWLIIDKRVQEH